MRAQDAGAFVEAKKWTEAKAAATAALVLDRENAAAAALQSQAQKAIDAGEDAAAAEEEAGTSWFEQLVEQWKVVFDEQIAPLGSLLLPLVGVLLLLVILARLVVLVVRDWPEPDAPPVSGRRRDAKDVIRPLVLLGGVLSVAGASLMVSAALSDSYTAPVSPPMAGSAAVVALLAWVPLVAAARVARGLLRIRHRAVPSWPLTLVSSGILVLALLGVLVRGSKAVDVSRTVELTWALGLALLLALQGICLLAWWLATRIRLDIKASSDAEVGTVAALLSELGAERPKGLEVPRGADVTALDGALAALPENAVLKVLKDILRSISGVTPWTATIEGDATARVVTVVRNGKTVGSAIIDPERMGLSTTGDGSDDAKGSTKGSAKSSDKTEADAETPDQTLKMAAAFVLMTMAEAHPVIRRGLAGAVTWKGVGYHYVASTLRPGGAQARELCARALDDDRENRAARLAFRHAIDRESVDCQPLSRYATFLESFIADLDEHVEDFETDALRLRATYTRAVIEVNAVHAHESGKHGSGPGVRDGVCSFDLVAHQEAAVAALDELDRLAPRHPRPGEVVDPDGQLTTLKRQLVDGVSGLRLLVGLDTEEPSPNSPTGMYNLGCTYASFDDVSWPQWAERAEAEAKARAKAAAEAGAPAEAEANAGAKAKAKRAAPDLSNPGAHDEQARPWLDLACQDPENKTWLAKDPQLRAFRRRVTYRTAYLADPRTDFFTLSAVEPLAKPLRSVGFGDVSLLAQASPVTLGSLVSADPTVSSQLVELAQLHRGLSRFTPPVQAPPEPVVTPLVEWLTAQLEAASPPAPYDPSLLEWGLNLLSQLTQDASPPPAAPQPEPGPPPNPLDGWEVEVLDELTSRGLARRSSLVALTAAERTALAEKIVAALMATFKPTSTSNLETYEANLTGGLATWMQSPS